MGPSRKQALHRCQSFGAAFTPHAEFQTPRMHIAMSFQIVIDTREQEPYGFNCETVSRKLEAGDYSVVGHEEAVVVERKSLPDFVHTVIHDFDRFAVELKKLAAMRSACVVVEADLDAVLRGLAADKLRGASPASVLGAALYVAVRYGVPVYWCGSRQAACAFTDQFLRMFVREGLAPGVSHA